jgi:hypothetical protein
MCDPGKYDFMGTNAKILQSTDLEQILNLERKILAQENSDSFEAEMSEWHAPWRRESLEYYLPLGWSFGLWSDNDLQAYFLAQPQLFISGMTQSLWIEQLQYKDEQQARDLLDIAYRLCREKHFQSLLFRNQAWTPYFSNGISVQKWDEHVYHVKTAKF